MYKIIKNGDVLAMTEAPNYIRRAENGCLALCREEEAEGIAYNNQIFQLEGRPDLEGSSATVTLEGSDAGSEITKAAAAGGILFVTMAEAGNIDAATAGEHAEHQRKKNPMHTRLNTDHSRAFLCLEKIF